MKVPGGLKETEGNNSWSLGVYGLFIELLKQQQPEARY